MQQMFEFGDTKKQEQIMYKTWAEFRNALATRKFSYCDIDDALNETYLHVFNDMFEVNGQKKRFTKSIKELREMGIHLARGARLKDDKPVDYDRFIPKSEFISEDNRFSPKGVEWLYLAVSDNVDTAEMCTVKECKAESGSYFGICQFGFDSRYDDLKLVDLTIANDKGYEDINGGLELFGQLLRQQAVDEPVPLRNKIKADLPELLAQIKVWVNLHYTDVHETLQELNQQGRNRFEPFCLQVRLNFLNLRNKGLSQRQIYDGIVEWLQKATNGDRHACEVVTAYFVQKCEVFDVITE